MRSVTVDRFKYALTSSSDFPVGGFVFRGKSVDLSSKSFRRMNKKIIVAPVVVSLNKKTAKRRARWLLVRFPSWYLHLPRTKHLPKLFTSTPPVGWHFTLFHFQFYARLSSWGEIVSFWTSFYEINIDHSLKKRALS